MQPSNNDLAFPERLFRVLMFDPLEPIMLPPVLRQIADAMPGIAIECVRGTADFVASLRGGEIDLACYAYPVGAPDIIAVPIISTDGVVIARRGHPGIRETLDRTTFGALGHVTLVPALRGLVKLNENLADQGLKRHVVYMVNKMASVAPIVERTDLIGVLPRWFAHRIARNFDIVIHEMPVMLPPQTVHMLWHARSTDDPGHHWLREAMLAAFREDISPRDGHRS
jgi:DNA-binding transcriptional LysR family regulator